MAPDKVYSLEDIKQHSSDKDCWIVVHGKVYDVTAFLEEHPGGYDIIVSTTGQAGAGGSDCLRRSLCGCKHVLTTSHAGC